MILDLGLPLDTTTKEFEIKNDNQLIECVKVILFLLRNKNKVFVQIVSRDKFKFAVTRKAYFAWIKDMQRSADNNGESIQQIHDRLKAKYLLPILCRVDSDFADLVLRETMEGITNPVIMRLLSISDSSVTTLEVLQEYFNECQRGEV